MLLLFLLWALRCCAAGVVPVRQSEEPVAGLPVKAEQRVRQPSGGHGGGWGQVGRQLSEVQLHAAGPAGMVGGGPGTARARAPSQGNY